MSSLKLVCPICSEEYTGNDDVYSTSCGHLYHYRCMVQWQNRSTTCPQCREHNPTSHKVYLNFETVVVVPTAPPIDEDMQAKLESSVDKINELQAQLQESELNFYHMQEQFTRAENTGKELQRMVAQSQDNESNFLCLHGQLSESEDRLKLLLEENERLSIENKYKAKEIVLRDTEILMLKESVALAKQTSTADTINNAKIAVLEQRLKHITGELQKEISNTTQLAIDKIKLQSYIQRMETQQNVTGPVSGNILTENRKFSDKITKAPDIKPVKHCGLQPVEEKQQMDNNSVVLNALPLKAFEMDLLHTVILIFSKMNVLLTQADIQKVKMLNMAAGRPLPQYINVVVQLKTSDMKQEILAKRALLKNDSVFGKVVVKEFVDEKVHALFRYANKNLRGTVFGYIACVNNTVVANKRHGDGADVVIQSKQQVDELLKNHILPKNETIASSQQPKLDESYYEVF